MSKDELGLLARIEPLNGQDPGVLETKEDR